MLLSEAVHVYGPVQFYHRHRSVSIRIQNFPITTMTLLCAARFRTHHCTCRSYHEPLATMSLFFSATIWLL
jgi:hypothetical protein